MSTLFVLLLIIVGISKINANCCTCCFPGQQPICQTPGINLPSCDECTSNFCAQHVKGCQGRYVCDVTCKSDSSTTSTKAKSSSTQTSITTTSNNAFTVRVGLIMIMMSLTPSIFTN
ncbi:unnamed protein product [Rotaria magnacalcarata]|uniref:Uncharacterized protein n=1 Tax=Rotaria magnacalcarata TaxID=392030 RepID=A0A815W194_9BILA|nr:unnamed protein product [Rotaria magnacalcarata]CAF1536047.1 unnamed protein product [Rotaria magnacalcarata]CAF4030998.1 unnamed protein product [Rotaria magnacalcarata]CAF4460302.1 unnamed protein product [Rotaria magnacalcarata]